MKKRKVAMFDIDGTIFRSSLVISMFEELVKQGLFPKKAKKEVETSFYAWVNRKGHYDDYIWTLVDLYIKYIKGCSEADIDRVTKDVINSEKDKTYRFTRNLIHDLKNKNYFLLAISASPDHIVSEFARHLSFDLSFGSWFEIKNGKFTGNAKSLHPQKKIILEQFFKARKNEVTLEGSIAVGDTESDIPLFEMAKSSIAFNPTAGLVKLARHKGWRIVVERKDVIYELTNFNILPAKSAI